MSLFSDSSYSWEKCIASALPIYINLVFSWDHARSIGIIDHSVCKKRRINDTLTNAVQFIVAFNNVSRTLKSFQITYLTLLDEYKLELKH